MLKAIETRYKGYRFRSRLEARWAVFFDELEFKWSYEPEGFNLNGVPYLPDFWIEYAIKRPGRKESGLYIEIKPRYPEKDACRKCAALAKRSGCPVILLYGNCGEEEYQVFIFDQGDLWQDDDIILTTGYCRTDCPSEDKVKQAFQSARSARF